MTSPISFQNTATTTSNFAPTQYADASLPGASTANDVVPTAPPSPVTKPESTGFFSTISDAFDSALNGLGKQPWFIRWPAIGLLFVVTAPLAILATGLLALTGGIGWLIWQATDSDKKSPPVTPPQA